MIVIIGLVSGVVFGGYSYYRSTQQRIATLPSNTAKLEVAVKSKAEALFLIKAGHGDFDSRTATNLPPTFKVLKEHTSAEEEEFWNQRTRDTWNRG